MNRGEPSIAEVVVVLKGLRIDSQLTGRSFHALLTVSVAIPVFSHDSQGCPSSTDRVNCSQHRAGADTTRNSEIQAEAQRKQTRPTAPPHRERKVPQSNHRGRCRLLELMTTVNSIRRFSRRNSRRVRFLGWEFWRGFEKDHSPRARAAAVA